jgi:HAD superfamily hydrolase (TIGR01490 family)
MSPTSTLPPLPGTSQPVVAVFDFDGTIMRGDSLRSFLLAVVGAPRWWGGLIVLSPRLLLYMLGMIPAWRVKEIVLTHFFAGWPEDQLRAAAEKFATDELSQLVKPAALERLRWHQQQRHHTILISASPELYLRPWARSVGIDEISCTRLATEQGVITGRILGKNCRGPEKVERLLALLGDRSRYCICAYGDSDGDKELLALADHAYYRAL